jgi:uncharacterized membrane-anchored protein
MSTSEPSPPALKDHPLRYALANELHARPFAALQVPSHALFLAIKLPTDAKSRDREADRAHLVALLDRFGATHPQPGATHYFGALGRYQIKWEQHSEFVTYTLFGDGNCENPFDPSAFDAFPADWLALAPGARISSALIRIEPRQGSESHLNDRLPDWFVSESLAVSRVADGSAVIAGDFRIDPAGHMRFAVFVEPGTSARRVGRIVQRLCELEVYKTMSLLALPMARSISQKMVGFDAKVSELVRHVKGGEQPARETLEELLTLSTELESLMARHAYRFSATNAYSALVQERIEVMREERFDGRQTFREFMLRRFDPAMRSITAAASQLDQMATRTKRAGDLLRTRVEVARSEQNQNLLASMDRRVALQLRLQKTVEGLSVVAIGYYTVNLLAYFLVPFAKDNGISKTYLMAGLTPLVLLVLWLVLHRIRKHLD